MFAIREFAVAHLAKELHVFLDAAITIRAVPSRFGQRAAVLTDLLRAQAVDVGLAHLDQFFCTIVQLVEVIGGVCQTLFPVEAEPVHVVLDRLHVLRVFLARVGVVETQEGLAVVLFRHAEIEANRFGVPDMQVAVWLRREAGDDRIVFPAREVVGDDLANEIFGFGVVHLARVCLISCAITADALDFKGLLERLEAQLGRSLPDQFVDLAVVQFRDRMAFPADQELPRVWIARVGAADEGIQGVEPVDKVGLDQEIQRTVDGRRRDLAAGLVQLVEDVVSADGLVAGPDQFQHPAALPRESQPPLATDLHGRGDGLRHAMVVIVLFVREPYVGARLVHAICSHQCRRRLYSEFPLITPFGTT